MEDKGKNTGYAKEGEEKRMVTVQGIPTVEEYEYVNHPPHYNNYPIEVIDMMAAIWGKAATATFCEMNAFKYRMRIGTKPGISVEQDLKKEKWYLQKAKELTESK